MKRAMIPARTCAHSKRCGWPRSLPSGNAGTTRSPSPTPECGGAMTGDPGEPDTSAWPWPASLDALSAAPRHHTLLLENDRVRVIETRIAPGDIVPVHTHCWPSGLYGLRWG